MMPPEGPNKAEELLQRFAKERRERSSDLSLHPATRRLLQGEVARQFKGKSENVGRWTWLTLWRGRFIAAGSFAVVGFLCWMAWDGSRSRQPQMEFAQANVEQDSSSQRKNQDLLAMSDPMVESVSLASEAKKGAAEKPVALLDGAKLRESRLAFQDSNAVPASSSPVPVDQFGTVASFYSVPPSTNAVDYTISLQPATTNALVASTALPQMTGFAYTFSESRAAKNEGAMSGPTNAGLLAGRSLIANEPQPAQQVALRNEQAVAERLQESELLARNVAPLSLDARGRDEVLSRTPAPLAMAPSSTVAPAAPAPFGAGLAAAPAETAWRRLTEDPTAPMRFYRMRSDSGLGRDSDRSPALAKQAEPAAQTFRVLERFVIEQQTNVVRVIDSDGSVYQGTMDVPVAVDAVAGFQSKDKALGERPQVADEKEELTARPAGYSFRAWGSNVTLRQNIEVAGRFTDETNVASAGISGGAGATGSPARRAIAQDSLRSGAAANQSAPAAIEGTLRVGTSEQRFRALRDSR